MRQLKKKSWGLVVLMLALLCSGALAAGYAGDAGTGGAVSPGSGSESSGPASSGSSSSGSSSGATSSEGNAEGTDDPGEDPAPTDESSAEPGTALALLEALPVKGRAAKTGYDRNEQFGNGWKDPDRNGCDARNDVLLRDLSEVVLDGPCKVLSGVLADPYTGQRIGFVRGQETSQAVQIDHVVALSDAWQKGAQGLSRERRVELANDPLNLLAVDGPTNNRKGDGDAATWLPPSKGFRCDYVARQVSVKAEYGLWVTAPEHDAIARVLQACPEQPAFESTLTAG